MRKLASVQVVNAAEPIPNADAIERIRILGWWVVVKKGEFKPGDKFVYCESDSLLPERPEFEFLRPSSFKQAVVDDGGVTIQPAGFRINLGLAYEQLAQVEGCKPMAWAFYFFGGTSGGISAVSGISPRIILLAAPTSFK
jgi:hypothetical protein